jgi:peptide/nickel transport system substrate-binding protein
VLCANLIKSQLFEVGIKININALSYKDYLSALKSGSFQLYLAEVKLNNNFDISPLVLYGGSCAYGITAEAAQSTEKTENDVSTELIISKYKNGQASIADVITTVNSQMPIIPICYRTGILFSNEKIENVDNSSYSDIYFSIESYSIKN